MSLLAAFEEAEHHRAAAAALVRANLPHGTLGPFISSLGRSAQWMHQVLRLSIDRDQGEDTALPSPRLIADLAARLPAERDIRAQVADHLLEARSLLRSRRRSLARIDAAELHPAVDDIRRASHGATFAAGGAEAIRLYQHVVAQGTSLAGRSFAQTEAVEFVEIHLCLQDALCVLDRPADALYYALAARGITEKWAQPWRGRDEERWGTLCINSARSVGIAYNNMGQSRAALRAFASAERLPAVRGREHEWAPHFGRDMLSALAKTSWLRRAAVEQIVTQAESAARRAMPDVARALLYIKRAECYVACGRFSEAHRQLDDLNWVLGSPDFGPLHRAIYLSGYVKLFARNGDRKALEFWGRRTIAYTAESGLLHQMRENVTELRRAGLAVEAT